MKKYTDNIILTKIINVMDGNHSVVAKLNVVTRDFINDCKNKHYIRKKTNYIEIYDEQGRYFATFNNTYDEFKILDFLNVNACYNIMDEKLLIELTTDTNNTHFIYQQEINNFSMAYFNCDTIYTDFNGNDMRSLDIIDDTICNLEEHIKTLKTHRNFIQQQYYKTFL